MGEESATRSLDEQLQEFVGRAYGEPTVARDPVNVPMIRHLTDALGDRNPVYTDEAFAERSVHGGIVAPATSLQVWTMQGLPQQDREPDPDDAQWRLMHLLESHGYVGVVATDCEQTYHRFLRPGDLLTTTSEVESVVGPKRTALGEGYFVTTLQTYRDQEGDAVGEMRFRILKFRPAGAPSGDGGGDPAVAAAGTGTEGEHGPEAGEVTGDGEGEERDRPDFPPPPVDSRFFWEGMEQHELRIQRCASCGRLRHPPRPACPWCRSLERDHVVSSGRGVVHSYVVHHHPPVPRRAHPFPVVLVELEEGTRVVGNVVGIGPDEVRIGLPVEVTFEQNHQGRTLAQWRPRAGGTSEERTG